MDTPDTAATSTTERSVDGKAMAIGLVLTAVFDVGVAILAFQLAKGAGASDQVAYLGSGVGPLIMMAITWIRARALSGVSVVILVFLVLSSLAAFVGGADPRLLIVKDSLVTGGFGLACLASLLFPRPLMFFFGARFATDGTPHGLAWWNGLWQYPSFRRSQYLITTIWGATFLAEAGVRIVVAYVVPSFDVAYAISTVLPFVVLAVLITVTIVIGRRTHRAAVAS